MRVLIVNTSERTGGAAVASCRLKNALNNHGVKAKMLVRDKQTDNITVSALPRKWMSKWHFLWERWCVFRHLRFSKKHLFEIDLANSGTDITRLPEFQEADVIHLEWINQGMLSLSDIRKILQSGKPVVWTMHDLWPATALCHYARDCRKYVSGCKECPLLPTALWGDVAHALWKRKLNVYARRHIHFVACSKWLGQMARRSPLLKGHSLQIIPNPIDSRVFHPIDKREARRREQLPQDKRIVLFVSQRATDPRKGMEYFVQALQLLQERYDRPEDAPAVVVLGGHAEELCRHTSLTTFAKGYVAEEQRLNDLYNAADVYVLPSLEDNLPNTIMEAMACGLPCVGFNVGGIPEMIDHLQSGYVAKARDAADLAEGIHRMLHTENREAIRCHTLSKVARCYSERAVALRYIETYQSAIAFKHYLT